MTKAKKTPAPLPNRRRPAAKPPKRPAAPSRLWGTTRRVMSRAVSIGLQLVVVAGVAAALVAVGLFVHHYVTSSEHFEIRDIEIKGMSRVGRDEILAAAGIAAGANVFKLDVDEARRKIEALPWILRASVERRLPGSVSVRVAERSAAALIELGGIYLVDAEGHIFKRLGERDPSDLPILTGLNRQVVIDHPEGAAEAIKEGLGLIAEYDDAGLDSRCPLSEVHREGASGWSLVLAEKATLIRLGNGPYRVKLGRLGRLFKELERRGMTAEYIYLDNRVRDDRATVKLRPQPEEPARGRAG